MKKEQHVGPREAAEIIGVTVKYVRDLLYEGQLEGAYKDENTGRWHIPISAAWRRKKQRRQVAV